MNFASYVVLAIVGVLFVLAVRYVLRHGGAGCGGNCSSGGGACPHRGKPRPWTSGVWRRCAVKKAVQRRFYLLYF